MNERDLLINLHITKGVGWKTIKKLVLNLDSLYNINDLKPLELSVKTDIDYALAEKVINSIAEENLTNFQELQNKLQSNKIGVITIFDDNYPKMLKEIYAPPWVIFTRGNINLLNESAISIVGTRSPTNYGQVVAKNLAKELVNYNFTIISGMARGIDKISHEGALANNGQTIAVLGSGIDVVYPKENKELYMEIIEKGLIISEYPPGTLPHPGHFPQRNRIISGLAYGTVIVEASIKSGSLITAQFALEQSREVFAIPGPITSKQSYGTNALIKQGAKLIQQVEDIIEEFPYLKNEKRENTLKEEILNENEKLIFELVSYTPIHINDLLNRINLNMSEIYECLLSLQLKGKIKQVPGGSYVRNI